MRHFIFYTIKITGSNRTGIYYEHLSVSEIVQTESGPEVFERGNFKFRRGASYGDLTEVKNFLARENVIESKFGEFGESDFQYYKWTSPEMFGFTIKRI